MLRISGLLITLVLLGYGLIRIAVGGLLLAQSYGLIDFNELANAILEVQSFFEVRVEKQIIPFSLSGYFAYIMAMGVFLTAGAIGVVFYKRWGFVILCFYLVMHGALFFNYQEINPKLVGFALQIALLVALFYLRTPRELYKEQISRASNV